MATTPTPKQPGDEILEGILAWGMRPTNRHNVSCPCLRCALVRQFIRTPQHWPELAQFLHEPQKGKRVP
jgi:hypothetical protein